MIEDEKENQFDNYNPPTYRTLNLKEKDNFFDNLKKRGFFSKILKFKRQNVKTVQQFGREFKKIENEQSKCLCDRVSDSGWRIAFFLCINGFGSIYINGFILSW